jgi:hypothetical protein
MGLVTNADEMSNVVEMATRLGDQTASASDRVGDFALLLANQSIPRLDNFGISSGRVRARIKELQEETAGLSREQAFMQAVMEQGGKSLDLLGERVDDGAAAFEKSQARMENFRVEMGKKLVPVAAKVMDIIAGLEDGTLLLIAALGGGITIAVKFGVAIKALAANITRAQLSAGALGVAVIGLVVVLEKFQDVSKGVSQAAQNATDTADTWSEQIREQVQKGGDLNSILEQQAQKTNAATQKFGEMSNVQKVVGLAFDVGGKKAKIFSEIQAEVLQAALENSTEYGQYTQALMTYNATVTDSNRQVAIMSEQQFNLARGVLPEVIAASIEAAVTTDQYNDAVVRSAISAGIFSQEIQFTATELQAMGNAALSSDQAMLQLNRSQAENLLVTDSHQLALRANFQATQERNAQVAAATALFEQIKARQEAAKQAAFDHTQELLRQAETLSSLDAAGTARAAISQLEELYSTGAINAAQYEEQVRAVQDSFGLVTEGGRFLAEGLDLITEGVASGQLANEQFNTVLQQLQERAEQGDTSLNDFAESVGLMIKPTEKSAEKQQEMADAFSEFKDVSVDSESNLAAHNQRVKESIEPISRNAELTDKMAQAAGRVSDPTDSAADSVDEFAVILKEEGGPAIDEFIEKVGEITPAANAVAASLEPSGGAMVANIQAGFDAAWPAFEADYNAKLQSLANQLPGSEPKDTSSPLYKLGDRGMAIVENLTGGVAQAGQGAVSEMEELGFNLGNALASSFESGAEDTIKNMFSAAGVLGGLGGAAAGILTERTIKPLEDRLKGAEAQAKQIAKDFGFQNVQDFLGLREAIIEELGGDVRLGSVGLRVARGEATQREEQLFRTLENVQKLDQQRVENAKELARQQERILKLQQAQQNLRFLEQQFRLLELIEERGLNAEEILQGLELGIDASVEGIVDAMARAMQEIVSQAEQELGIGSPSKVFESIGEFAMQGLAMGIQRSMIDPVTQSALAMQRLISAPVAAAGAAVSQSRSVVTHEGDTNVNINANVSDSVGLNRFANRVDRVVTRGMRGVK